MVKNPLALQEPQEIQVQLLGQKDSLEEGMGTHSSTEEPGGLQSMGLKRAGHDQSDLARTEAKKVSG